MTSGDQVLELARAAGFDLAGFAPVAPPPDVERFDAWLEGGHHADMTWLETQAPRIRDPRLIRDEARTMLVVGRAHSRPPLSLPDGGRIARYAAGRDYHNAMGKDLRRLSRRLEQEGLAKPLRGIVDAGPVLERSHAAVAGLGFLSKAANLLHPDFGPWFFLGELLLADEFDSTGPPPPISCGTCRACIDICPTDAIREPGRVDAGRCISYQTIENRGSIPRSLRGQHGDWLFGCDLCSEVCPFGAKAPDTRERWGEHPGLVGETLVSLVGIRDDAEFDRRFEGSPLRRTRRPGLARNAALVLGNHPSEAGKRALLRALDEDASALVREAAAWGLARGHGDETPVRGRLEAARRREVDPETRIDMGRNLDPGAGEKG